MRIFIINENNNYIILNVEENNSFMLEQLSNAYEMPQEEVKQVFKGNEHLASNLNCTITKLKNNFKVVFNLDETKLLNDLKERKLNELENIKTQAENADVLYKDKMYQADSKAKELLTQSLVIFSSVGAVPEGFVWKSSDNSLNAFSLDDLKALSLLIAQRLQEITVKYWAYKGQIRNATTKEELDLIKIEF